MADDSYKTIKQVAEGYYTEKRSRFISYAIPVRTVEEVKEQLEKYRVRSRAADVPGQR